MSSPLVDELRSLIFQSKRQPQLTWLFYLVPVLPKQLLLQAIRIAALIEDRSLRTSILARLLARLPQVERETLLEEALIMAQEIKVPFMQARALISLAPYLSPGLLQEALKTVLAFEGFTEAVGGLNALAPYLSPGLLQEALKTVLAFEGFTEAVGGLNALAPYLSPGLLQEALKT